MMMSLPLMASADDSGTCGYDVTWRYEEATHTLIISGTGMMETSYAFLTPWHKYRDMILKVIVEDGITIIGEKAFSGCSSLTSVSIPQ